MERITRNERENVNKWRTVISQNIRDKGVH